MLLICRKPLLHFVGAFVVVIVVMVTYHPALSLGLFADDYRWIDLAGRVPLLQYLDRYFNPWVQTQWYRPLQGMQWKITYLLFGADPMGYHILNILLHLVSCLLFYRIVGRVTQRWAVAALGTILFACLTVSQPDNPNGNLAPLDFWFYNLAVLWSAVVDPLETVFYLWAMDTWVSFLYEGNRRDYLLALVANILALMCKEVGVTLPIVLFLMDRLVIAQPAKPIALARRYVSFVLVLLAYLPIALRVQSQSVFTQYVGYGLGSHILSNLTHFFQALVLPWGIDPLSSRVWLFLMIIIFLYFIAIKRDRRVIFLAVGATLTLLPVALFPFVVLRYLYIPLMFASAFFAYSVSAAQHFLPARRWSKPLLSGAMALLVVLNSHGVATQTVEFARLISETESPFALILTRHTTFPSDGLLYFIDPPMLSQDLAGYFLLKYGPTVNVRGTDQGARAKLRDSAYARIFYFDDAGHLREQPVSTADATSMQPSLPITFDAPIQLEGYELASSHITRGDAIVLILYWRATQRLDKNYTVFVHLVDSKRQMIEGYDSEPQGGRAPTSSWRPNSLAISSAVITLAPDTPLGNGYRLEVGLYDLRTMQRLFIMDAQGKPITDTILIAPLDIVE